MTGRSFRSILGLVVALAIGVYLWFLVGPQLVHHYSTPHAAEIRAEMLRVGQPADAVGREQNSQDTNDLLGDTHPTVAWVYRMQTSPQAAANEWSAKLTTSGYTPTEAMRTSEPTGSVWVKGRFQVDVACSEVEGAALCDVEAIGR